MYTHNVLFYEYTPVLGMGILMFIGCPVDDVAGLKRLDG